MISERKRSKKRKWFKNLPQQELKKETGNKEEKSKDKKVEKKVDAMINGKGSKNE